MWIYEHGYSFRTVAKFFKVNVHSTFVLGKTFAENNYSNPASTSDSLVIELEEMWRFWHSKKDKFGVGRRIAEQQNSSSVGVAAHDMLKHLEKERAIEKNRTSGSFSAIDTVFVVILYHTNIRFKQKRKRI